MGTCKCTEFLRLPGRSSTYPADYQPRPDFQDVLTSYYDPTTQEAKDSLEKSARKPKTATNHLDNDPECGTNEMGFALWVKGVFKKFLMVKGINDDSQFTNNSLFLFHRENKFRSLLINLAENRAYPLFVHFSVLLHTLTRLAGYIKGSEDTFSETLSGGDIVVGTILILDMMIKAIAFGLLGHPKSYIRKDSMNIFEITLTIIFFFKSLFYLQSFQIFRIFAILSPFKTFKAFNHNNRLISRALMRLAMFEALYILMIFLFSMVSWLIFYDHMNVQCVARSSLLTTPVTAPELSTLYCQSHEDCVPLGDYLCLDILNNPYFDMGSSMPETGFGRRNFRSLGNSFLLTLLISNIVNITEICSELNLTGGGPISTFYLLFKIIFFGFVIRSFFVSILYDTVMNHHSENMNELTPTSPKVGTNAAKLSHLALKIKSNLSPTPQSRRTNEEGKPITQQAVSLLHELVHSNTDQTPVGAGPNLPEGIKEKFMKGLEAVNNSGGDPKQLGLKPPNLLSPHPRRGRFLTVVTMALERKEKLLNISTVMRFLVNNNTVAHPALTIDEASGLLHGQRHHKVAVLGVVHKRLRLVPQLAGLSQPGTAGFLQVHGPHRLLIGVHRAHGPAIDAAGHLLSHVRCPGHPHSLQGPRHQV